MTLSRSGPAVSAPLAKRVSVPAASRATRNTGCTRRCASSPRWVSSPMTELDEKRHVVIDEFDNRDVLEARTVGGARGRHADLRGSRPALGEKPPARGRDVGELRRLVADDILGGGTGEQPGHEVDRRVGRAVAQDRARLGQQHPRDALVRARGRRFSRALRRRRRPRRCGIAAGTDSHGRLQILARRLRSNAARRKGTGFRAGPGSC